MTILALHVANPNLPKIDYPVAQATRPGFSSVYVKLAQENPVIEHYLRDHFTNKPRDPVILAAWSAGCFAAREWLRQKRNRDFVDGAVLLDGLHTPGPPCDKATLQGIIDFAHTGKPLVITHTRITPPNAASTAECADLLREEIGHLPNVVIIGTDGDDADEHAYHTQVLGPPLIEEVVALVEARRQAAATAMEVATKGAGVTYASRLGGKHVAKQRMKAAANQALNERAGTGSWDEAAPYVAWAAIGLLTVGIFWGTLQVGK